MKTLKKLLLFVVHPPCWQAAPPIKMYLWHAESRGSEQLQGRSSPL